MKLSESRCALLLALGLAGAAQAQTDAPRWPAAITPGLWRITTTAHLLGPPQYPGTMNDLPPDQRMNLQSLIGREGTPLTRDVCLTPDRLARGVFLGERQPVRCQQDLRVLSATRVDITAVCGAITSRTRFHAAVNLPAPGTLAGRYEVDRTGGSGPIHIAAVVTGHFLQPGCAR